MFQRCREGDDNEMNKITLGGMLRNYYKTDGERGEEKLKKNLTKLRKHALKCTARYSISIPHFCRTSLCLTLQIMRAATAHQDCMALL